MSITNTNAVAKVAAVVAGLGLVAMSFASFAPAKAATSAELQAQIDSLLATIASLQGQLGSSQGSASATFTRDLTIGSTGADVTALQNWLISKGNVIAAGATGYFGAQTQAALAAWQAANGVSPAAGYFGPITRAKVNAMAGGTSNAGGVTGTGGLSGGEADLNNFDLLAGDDLMEGDTDAEIAIAKFDVDDADVRIQRVTVDFQPTDASYSEKPWDYVDSLSVYSDGKKIGSADVGSKDDWDKQDDDSDHADTLDFYTVDIAVNGVIEEGSDAELSIRADAQGSIDDTDLSQTFLVQIPDDGVRAVDGAGIQQYVGDGEEITLGFDSAEDGDLTIKKSSDNPEAGTLVADDTDTSDEFTVLKFEIKNTDEADATLTDLTVTVATSTASGSSAADITDIIRRATLTVDGDEFDGDVNANNTIDFDDVDANLAGDETTDFTLTVELFGQSGHYASSGEALTFTVSSGNVTAEGADTGDASTKSGTATGNQQSVVINGGITVEGNSMTAVQTYNSTTPTASYGTFTLKYDLTAVGDAVYVPKVATTTGATSGTTASTTYAGAVVLTSMSASTTDSVVTVSMTSTADSENANFYVVNEGDTETFTVTVIVNPLGLSSSLTSFQVGLDSVKFSTSSTNLQSLQTLDVDQTESDFQTESLTIAG